MIDVMLGMSDKRRREILAMARALAKVEAQEPTELDRGIDRVEGGENPPRIVGGE
jgi:hypothetical protein